MKKFLIILVVFLAGCLPAFDPDPAPQLGDICKDGKFVCSMGVNYESSDYTITNIGHSTRVEVRAQTNTHGRTYKTRFTFVFENFEGRRETDDNNYIVIVESLNNVERVRQLKGGFNIQSLRLGDLKFKVEGHSPTYDFELTQACFWQ